MDGAIAPGANFPMISALYQVKLYSTRALHHSQNTLGYIITTPVYILTMPEVIEIPIELTYFQLPEAVQDRLQLLLDRQDAGEILTLLERREAEGLVELTEFLSLLRLRSQRVAK